jgi:predicted enzyme related to lactoylglutathione lyase
MAGNDTERETENMTPVPDMRLELVPVPVTDVDRAKAFYIEKAGFKLEVDTRPNDSMRVVQLTPPGSACTIVFGTGMAGISAMQPGSIKGLHLVVADIRKSRAALVNRGLAVGEVEDFGGVLYAEFSDPDGNTWLLQEFPSHLGT